MLRTQNSGMSEHTAARKTSLNLPLPLQFLATRIGVWLGRVACRERLGGSADCSSSTTGNPLNGCDGVLAPDAVEVAYTKVWNIPAHSSDLLGLF
jgi:hypothetical protein